MSWRNAGSTGANTIPLGKRRFGDDDGHEQNGAGVKRGRSVERTIKSEPGIKKEPEFNPDGTKKRRKNNRWGDAGTVNKAAGLMNLPTAVSTTSMTAEQLDAYVMHLRIEEISQKLRINDIVPADGDRSPSPPPQYDNAGRRVNTREYRYKKKLEEERHKLIEKAMRDIPNYRPPSDYRRPTKTQEKVYVPVNDYPEINFIGLLIGPRGNTLKKMEQDSGAKIAIRGKGSVKEGKGKSDAAHASNQDEDLHCLIMADTEEKVNKAKLLIHQVIETAASTPEAQNELKRHQLRELAALNGTLRDDENQACQNCGEIGHRKYDCPQQRNFTANIICRVCGNAGHMARDCPDRVRGGNWRDLPPRGRLENNVDNEYQKLMEEIGGSTGSGATSGRPMGQIGWEGGNGDAGRDNAPDNRPPWARGPTGPASGGPGGPPPWQQNRGPSNPPPWANQGQGQGRGGGGYGGGYGGGNGGYNDVPPPPPPGPSSSIPPWQQNRAAPPPWANNNSNGGGQGGMGGGYGGAPPPPPWQQPSRQQYDAPPPPPPPPSDIPPPPPPPSN